MGLSIRGEGTGDYIGWNYSTLHLAVRQVALIECGMPLNLADEGKPVKNGMGFYMHPYIDIFSKEYLPTEKLLAFISAVQLSGYHYPNIMFHSDCEGKYTLRGKIFNNNWMSGNSKKLYKELKDLYDNKTYRKLQNERFEKRFCNFYELVKNEVLNGKGIIKFS